MWLDLQAEFTITTNKQALLFDMSIALFLAWIVLSVLTCLGFMHFQKLEVAGLFLMPLIPKHLPGWLVARGVHSLFFFFCFF